MRRVDRVCVIVCKHISQASFLREVLPCIGFCFISRRACVVRCYLFPATSSHCRFHELKVETRHLPQAKFDRHLGPGRGRSGYLRASLVRSLLLAHMRRDGVRALGGADGVIVRAFATAFPDTNSWFDRLPAKGCKRRLADFFGDLGYDGRPEFFSMFSCLLMTPPCSTRSDAWYKANARKLRRLMASYRTEHGLHPTPAHSLSLMRPGKRLSQPSGR